MKGLDLLLVLLILLSWRRCSKSQETTLFTLVARALTNNLVSAVQSFSDIDESVDDDGYLKGFGNISSTTLSSIKAHHERLWDETKFPEGSYTNGLTGSAHHTHAHDHDFDYGDNDKDNFYNVREEEKHLEEFTSLPHWIVEPHTESVKHKVLEHRRLRAYLRRHHYQHVKRHRLLIQQREKHLKQHERPYGKFKSQLVHEKNQKLSGNVTVEELLADAGSTEDQLERDKKLRVHHFDHEFIERKSGKITAERESRRVEDKRKVNHQSQDEISGGDGASGKKGLDTAHHHEDKLESHETLHLGPNKVFRHSNRFLDKFYMDTKQGFLDPENLNNIDLNVSTISELIWRLRGMRSRRRRSFQALSLNQTGNLSESSSSVDPRKLIPGNFTWPLKRIAEIEGDIWLGALMMVHEREDNITCGPIMPQVCYFFHNDSI